MCVELEEHERQPGDIGQARLRLPPVARPGELSWSRAEANSEFTPTCWRGNVPALLLAAMTANLLGVPLAAVLDTTSPAETR